MLGDCRPLARERSRNALAFPGLRVARPRDLRCRRSRLCAVSRSRSARSVEAKSKLAADLTEMALCSVESVREALLERVAGGAKTRADG